MSAKSLQKVCTSCQKKMAHHFAILLQIVQAIDSLSISTAAVLEFFQGICICILVPLQELNDMSCKILTLMIWKCIFQFGLLIKTFEITIATVVNFFDNMLSF